MEDRLSGFLNVRKGPGETSHSVVARVRRLLGQKRVGHAGTLDPAAVGVLPIAVGPATRLAMAPGWDLKVYWGDVWFGVATTTDDSEGDVVAESNPSRVDLGAIERALGGFVGDIVQEPPAYSAIRVGGRRAYEGARRGDLARPPARPARIDAIWVVGWTPPLLSLLIQCRSGTYVRSLARDLGQSVGCPAHLSALVRTRVGPFGLDDALRYDQLEAVAQHGAWNRVLWPTDVAAAQLDVVVTGELEELGFGQGRAWPAREYPTGDVRVFSQAGRFLGLASQRGDGMWRPRVVLESAA